VSFSFISVHIVLVSSLTSPPRVRENMVTTLTRKFVDEMKLYQQAQQTYKSDLKNKVKRQVLVVKPDATDEEGTSRGSLR
jgi:Syntaxin